MEMVTGDQVKEAVQKAGLNWVNHHNCGCCGVMVGYVIDGDQISFRSGCGCSWPPDRPTTWGEAAEHINRQQRTGKWGDVAAKVAKEFGMELPPPEVTQTAL
jgi:hypothetical protein